MAFAKTEIVVVYNDEKLGLPCNSEGNIDVATLKLYYPDAVGLTYTDSSGMHACLVQEHEIILPVIHPDQFTVRASKSKFNKHIFPFFCCKILINFCFNKVRQITCAAKGKMRLMILFQNFAIGKILLKKKMKVLIRKKSLITLSSW